MQSRKIEQKVQRVPRYIVTCSIAHIINILHHCGTVVEIDKPKLAHYYKLKSIIHIRAHSVTLSVSFDKCITTCIHHYSLK